jgi:hypothetical protein
MTRSMADRSRRTRRSDGCRRMSKPSPGRWKTRRSSDLRESSTIRPGGRSCRRRLECRRRSRRHTRSRKRTCHRSMRTVHRCTRPRWCIPIDFSCIRRRRSRRSQPARARAPGARREGERAHGGGAWADVLQPPIQPRWRPGARPPRARTLGVCSALHTVAQGGAHRRSRDLYMLSISAPRQPCSPPGAVLLQGVDGG